MSLSDYTSVRKIGQGSFGEVWLHRHNKDNKQYVIKKMILTDEEMRQSAETEIQLLSHINHPNVVSYRASFTASNVVYLIMEYCDSGDLSDRINRCNRERRALGERQIMDWTLDLCLAIQHIHARNILHRDLKPQNIFLTQQNIIKIGDFGISRTLKPGDLASTVIGTPLYVSPEVMQRRPYDNKVDIWSLGCCIYEMMTLHPAVKTDVLIMLRVRMVNPMPTNYNLQFVKVVQSMLTVDVTQRPTINQVLDTDVLKTAWINRRTVTSPPTSPAVRLSGAVSSGANVVVVSNRPPSSSPAAGVRAWRSPSRPSVSPPPSPISHAPSSPPSAAARPQTPRYHSVLSPIIQPDVEPLVDLGPVTQAPVPSCRPTNRCIVHIPPTSPAVSLSSAVSSGVNVAVVSNRQPHSSAAAGVRARLPPSGPSVSPPPSPISHAPSPPPSAAAAVALPISAARPQTPPNHRVLSPIIQPDVQPLVDLGPVTQAPVPSCRPRTRCIVDIPPTSPAVNMSAAVSSGVNVAVVSNRQPPASPGAGVRARRPPSGPAVSHSPPPSAAARSQTPPNHRVLSPIIQPDVEPLVDLGPVTQAAVPSCRPTTRCTVDTPPTSPAQSTFASPDSVTPVTPATPVTPVTPSAAVAPDDVHLYVTQSRPRRGSFDEVQNDLKQVREDLAKLGFGINSKNEVVDTQTNEKFLYAFSDNKEENEKRYQQIAQLLTRYVQAFMVVELNMSKRYLPLDGQAGEAKTFIFTSDDIDTNANKLMVLIQGNGAPRAGEWARKVMLNDSLDAGSQLPWIDRAITDGFAVVVLNPNENTELIAGKEVAVRENVTSLNHVTYVWDHVISLSPAKKIVIVAHSYGGSNTIELACSRSRDFLSRVTTVALTDSVHEIPDKRNIVKFLRKYARNWVASSKPLDTLVDTPSNDVPRVSAGETRHEWTTHSSFNSVFKFVQDIDISSTSTSTGSRWFK